MRINAKFKPGDEVFVIATEAQRMGEPESAVKPYVVSAAGPRVYKARVHSLTIDGEGEVGYLFKHGFMSHGDTGTQVRLYDLTLDSSLVFSTWEAAVRRLMIMATDEVAEFRANVTECRGEADWL